MGTDQESSSPLAAGRIYPPEAYQSPYETDADVDARWRNAGSPSAATSPAGAHTHRTNKPSGGMVIGMMSAALVWAITVSTSTGWSTRLGALMLAWLPLAAWLVWVLWALLPKASPAK